MCLETEALNVSVTCFIEFTDALTAKAFFPPLLFFAAIAKQAQQPIILKGAAAALYVNRWSNQVAVKLVFRFEQY